MDTLQKLEATCQRCGKSFPYVTSNPERKPPRWCITCAKIERFISQAESRRIVREERRRRGGGGHV